MVQPVSKARFDSVIDAAHLDRQTMGDAGLANELLELFVAQSQRSLDLIDMEPLAAAETAHALKGAARAVGAFQVAEAAETLELLAGSGSELADARSELGQRIEEARQFIETLHRS